MTKSMSISSHSYISHDILINNKITSKNNQIYHILLNTGLPCYEYSILELINNSRSAEEENKFSASRLNNEIMKLNYETK